MKSYAKRAAVVAACGLSLAAVCGSAANAAPAPAAPASGQNTTQSANKISPTRFEVRNETNKPGYTPATFELWAYQNGNKENTRGKVATLTPGQSWVGTAKNEGSGYYDHNILVVVDGIPRMRLVGDNPWCGWPGVHATFNEGSANKEIGSGLSEDESKGFEGTGIYVWTWRTKDSDDTKKLYACVWKIPALEYSADKDGGKDDKDPKRPDWQ